MGLFENLRFKVFSFYLRVGGFRGVRVVGIFIFLGGGVVFRVNESLGVEG